MQKSQSSVNPNNINIVLVEPKSAGNVGSVCRAMKTMQLSHLSLVNPADYHTDDGYGMALLGSNILESATVHDDLKHAICDSSLVIGLTRRHGQWRKVQYFFHEIVDKIVSTSQNNKVSLVFGTEDSGLSQSDADTCHILAQIASDEKCGSLNLSHAVMVACYELFKYDKTTDIMHNSIDFTKLEELMNVISSTLNRIGYFKQDEPERTLQFLRSIYSRAGLDDKDFFLLKKMFYRLQGTFEHGFIFSRLKAQPEVLENRFKGVLKLVDIVNPLEKQAIQLEQNLKHIIDKPKITELLFKTYFSESDRDAQRAFWVLLFLKEYPIIVHAKELLNSLSDRQKLEKVQLLLYLLDKDEYSLPVEHSFNKSLLNTESISILRPLELQQLLGEWDVIQKMLFIQYCMEKKDTNYLPLLNELTNDTNFRIRYELGYRLRNEPFYGYLPALLLLKRDKHLRIRSAAKDTLDLWHEIGIIEEDYVRSRRDWEEPPKYCFANKEDEYQKHRFILFVTEIKYRVYSYAFVTLNIEDMILESIEGVRRIKEYKSIQDKIETLCKKHSLTETSVKDGIDIIYDVVQSMEQTKKEFPKEWKKWQWFIKNLGGLMENY